MTAELVLSVFVLLVLAFVGGHQLAVHRMTRRGKPKKLRPRPPKPMPPRPPPTLSKWVVGREALDGAGRWRPATEQEIAAAKERGDYQDEDTGAGWVARGKEIEAASARFIGEKPPRDTGHLGTPMDRIPLRKASRGNGHETPYARKKRAAKPKGKA